MATDVADSESCALAKGLLEAAPDAIFVVRAGGGIARANRMAEQLFGYDRSELLGEPIEMLMAPEVRAGHVTQRRAYEQGPRTRPMGELKVLYGRRKDGSFVPVEVSLSPLSTSEGSMTIAIVRDVTRRVALEAELRHASTHDALTGLFNRTHLDAERPRLETECAPLGVVIADVDGLKPVNDQYGHEAGDEILRRTAGVLRAASESRDLVVRLGGDEFAVVRPHCSALALASMLNTLHAELARDNARHPVHPLALSLGAALTEPRGGLALAMRLADQRMYDEKRAHASQRPPVA